MASDRSRHPRHAAVPHSLAFLQTLQALQTNSLLPLIFVTCSSHNPCFLGPCFLSRNHSNPTRTVRTSSRRKKSLPVSLLLRLPANPSRNIPANFTSRLSSSRAPMCPCVVVLAARMDGMQQPTTRHTFQPAVLARLIGTLYNPPRQKLRSQHLNPRKKEIVSVQTVVILDAA
ncbi:hypothetical protein CH063_04199, partial [Colletotrichum higginsianum]